MIIKQIYDAQGTYKERFLELTQYCFQMCTREDFEKDWDTAPVDKAIWGAIEEEELASSIILSKKEVFMNNQPVKMYGVGGVATASTFRSGGVCSKLLKHCLEYMNEEEVVYSMLAPFSFEFYGKLGWKWCYNTNTYKLDINRLKGIKSIYKVEKYKDNEYDILNQYYCEQVQKINGAMLRNTSDWNKRLDKGNGRYTVICKDDDNQIKGYMIYKIVSDTLTFEVVEINYTSVEGLKALLRHVYNHSAQTTTVHMTELGKNYIKDIISNPEGGIEERTRMMARIVNVERALKFYSYQKEGTLCLEVKDDTCEWNNQRYLVINERDTISIEMTNIEELTVDIKLDIRELTQLLMGFRTIEDLMFLERIEVYNKDAKNFFKRHRDCVAIYDYF